MRELMRDEAIAHAQEIVNASEWSGDMRVNMTRVIGAGRVLNKALKELQSEIELLRTQKEKLWLWVAGQRCECYDDDGTQRDKQCSRCTMLWDVPYSDLAVEVGCGDE